jgi:acetolactate decarboxylase
MDREESMAHIAVKISSLLESVARDLSTERKTSLDNLVSAALSEYLHSSPRRMYQISTSTALVEGVYGGSVPSSTLLENGDFGLGTFEGLDGEMVTLDGEIYQAAGSVRRRSDDFFVPFATITHFRGDAAVPIEKVACLKDIELACDPHRISENLFYALRVDGVFDTIHARAVHPVPQGSRLLHAGKKTDGIPLQQCRGHACLPLVSEVFEFLSACRGITSILFRRTAEKVGTFSTAPRRNLAQAFKLCTSTTFGCHKPDRS